MLLRFRLDLATVGAAGRLFGRVYQRGGWLPLLVVHTHTLTQEVLVTMGVEGAGPDHLSKPSLVGQR
jgi:hypothetical protein